jgi:hypothetical protein
MSSELLLFLMNTGLIYLNIFGYILVNNKWFLNFLLTYYVCQFYYVARFVYPMVFLNQGWKDIIIQMLSIRSTIRRITQSQSVPFWEIGFLHENIVTRKIVSYLTLKLQDEHDLNTRQTKATKIL